MGILILLAILAVVVLALISLISMVRPLCRKHARKPAQITSATLPPARLSVLSPVETDWSKNEVPAFIRCGIAFPVLKECEKKKKSRRVRKPKAANADDVALA